MAKQRRLGGQRRVRDAAERARLRRMIVLIDRLFAGGPNCYRRALVEMAMDGGAAMERLHMGLNTGATTATGHAWLDSSPDKGAGYQVEFLV